MKNPMKKDPISEWLVRSFKGLDHQGLVDFFSEGPLLFMTFFMTFDHSDPLFKALLFDSLNH